MKIAIISMGEALFSTKSIVKAAEEKNHSVEILDPTYCNISIENGTSVLHYHDEIINGVQAVIPRIGASNTYYGTSIVRQFEAKGIFSVVTSEGITLSRDKWNCFQILSKFGIAVPNTFFPTFLNTERIIDSFQGKPLIIKLTEGTHGEGVILAPTQQNAIATAEALHTAGVRFLLQEYIEESKGADIRAIVVDGKVVAAMKRQCKNGDFRSNLHRGGSGQEIQLSKEEENVAIRAAKALNLGVCGVDILQSRRGPLVLEINSSPGLEGIETITGTSVSNAIVAYIEGNLTQSLAV